MNSLIIAKKVYDGGEVSIPEEMGAPRDDQMQGTPAERLVELAGRACYDSLGIGRPSFDKIVRRPVTDPVPVGVDPDFGKMQSIEYVEETLQGYHSHIKQVRHGSVWEHFNFTIFFPCDNGDERHLIAWLCMNRPGVMALPGDDGVRVTLNIRSLMEWPNFTVDFYQRSPFKTEYFSEDAGFYMGLLEASRELFPHIASEDRLQGYEMRTCRLCPEPVDDHESWVSMYMSMSRGCSHELVRHGDFTAISQRSTRFVDESESEWIEHPLETANLSQFRQEMVIPMGKRESVVKAGEVYRKTVAELEPWLIARGIDKLGARKQARGAARGYLGNALLTSMIFSANVAQWKRMLRQRASVFADAEIRELFCKALTELKASRYGQSFENWELQDSPDGIGQIAVEK